jgi:hypothetical protein
MMEIIYSKGKHEEIKRVLGKRPGDYVLDPYYLRKGIGDKPYFWDEENRRWRMVRLGDLFTIEEDGSITHTPVGQVTKEAS